MTTKDCSSKAKSDERLGHHTNYMRKTPPSCKALRNVSFSDFSRILPALSHVTVRCTLSVTCDYPVWLICHMWLICMPHRWLFSTSCLLQVTFQIFSLPDLSWDTVLPSVICVYSACRICHILRHSLTYLSHVTVLYTLYVTCDCSVCLMSHMWLLCLLYTLRMSVQCALYVTCDFPVWLICHMWLSSTHCLPHVTFQYE